MYVDVCNSKMKPVAKLALKADSCPIIDEVHVHHWMRFVGFVIKDWQGKEH